jgi:hypothetical protein
MDKKKLCKKCGKEFEAVYRDQVYCQNPCTGNAKKSIEEKNKDWIKVKKTPKKKSINFHI